MPSDALGSSVTDGTANPVIGRSRFESWIDAPANGALPSACGSVAGWCFRRDGRPISAIRAKVGDRVFPGFYGHARPDVAAAFVNEAGSLHSGFDVPVLTSRDATCTIEASDAEGTWEAVRACELRPALPFAFVLDEPDEPIDSSRRVLRGWFDEAAGTALTQLRARIGQRVFRAVLVGPRPDVHARFGNALEADACGFEIPIVVSRAPSTCELEAQGEDGTWKTLRSIAVADTARRGGLELLKWSRFWVRAWLGRPARQEDVSMAERDFAVAVMRQRGWFNLDIVPQYAARPVAPERFPLPSRSTATLSPLIVVTPSYQQVSFLEQTLRSVLEQQGVNVHYIVQDGGSTDGSVALIERYASRLAYWESARDAGQGDAINRGFARSAGQPDDVLMYLNSDDVLLPGAARFVLEYFARHPDVDAVYGHRVLIDARGDEVGRWFTPRQKSDDLRLVDHVPQETLFWRRRIWDRVGGIDPSFQYALDWDLLLRFQAAGARIVRLPWFLGEFRIHAAQKSTARLAEDGIPEMTALRLRAWGRAPSFAEIHRVSRRAQLDSALVGALFRRGWRV